MAAIGSACAWARTQAEAAGAKSGLIDDMDVCIEEALANLVMHGTPAAGLDKQIGLEIAVSNGEIVVTIEDICVPFDVEHVAPPAPGARAVGGAGLRILHAIADEVRYAPADPSAARVVNHLSIVLRDPTAVLAAVPAFSGVPTEVLAELGASALHETFASGALLARQGEVAEGAYVVTRGAVDVIAARGGEDVVLATLSAPVLVGEIGAVANVPRTASVRAVGEVRAVRLTRAALLAAGYKHPPLLVQVIARLGDQIRAVNGALGLYATGFAALERGDLTPEMRAALMAPPPDLAPFAAALARLADRIAQERRLRSDMAAAAAIQRALLPAPSAFSDPRCDVFADIKPAREVGGDFYEIMRLDEDHLLLAIGDVCGKGVAASLFMSVVLTALRIAARTHDRVEDIVAAANDHASADNATSMFATLFCGIVDLRNGDVSYVNCGHVGPLRVSAGRVTPLEGVAPPIGLFPGRAYRTLETRLARGDMLVCVSDGVTEAMTSADEEYGDARLAACLLRAGDTAEGCVNRIIADVDAFVGDAEPSDDLTCLVVRLV